MRATWLADRLRAAGLTVVETDGWRERGSAGFEPRGVVVHHTASNRTTGDAPSLNICIKGRPDLPGPLCQVLIGRSGRCYLIASGRANHAGSGGWRGLSGNSSVLGIEAENDGRGEPWSADLMRAFLCATAVCLGGIDQDASWCCGHKEWTSRKIDPAGINMDAFRGSVASLLGTPPEQGDGDLTPNEHAMLEGVFNGVRGQNENLLPRIVKLLEEIKAAVQQQVGGG